MSNKKDVSGFNPQERHKIIVDYLHSINKPTKVFHLRWKPGDLLTGKVLESTPIFWYMKYKWSRTEIEIMFYKARCVIGPLFDKALQQTYGGSVGPRWRGTIIEKQKSSWRQRKADKLAGWEAERTRKIMKKQENDEKEEQKELEMMEREKKTQKQLDAEEKKTLTYKSKDIWNAVSDFGVDKSIDYKIFSDNLKDRGINVSSLLAKQLFDQLAGPGVNLSRQEMEELIKELDKMHDSATVTWDMLGDKLGCMTIMKRVLLAAGIGEPFNVDDFIFASKFGVSISPIQFLNKLCDRDVPWDDRVRAMEQLGANLGTNPLFNNVLAKGNIPELLCGWATQILDNKPEVQKTAIDTLPNVFHNAIQFGDKDITVGYLEEVLDNLFKVLDDPHSHRNHPTANDAICKIINDILHNGDPESVLVVSHILAEKCDIENANNPQTRQTALTGLQKIMFGAKNPYSKFDEIYNLPSKATVNREWLDIATNKESAPSSNYMQRQNVNGSNDVHPRRNNLNPHKSPHSVPKHEYIPNDQIFVDDECNDQNANKIDPHCKDPDKPRRRTDKQRDIMLKYPKYRPQSHTDTEISAMNRKTYPINPDNPIKEEHKDASHSGQELEADKPSSSTTKGNAKFGCKISIIRPPYADPANNYVFGSADGSPAIITPVINSTFNKPGTHSVNLTATDKYGSKDNASFNQQVIDPKDTKQNPSSNGYIEPIPHPSELHAKNGLISAVPFQPRITDPEIHDNDPNQGPSVPKNKNYGGHKGKGTKLSTDPVDKFNEEKSQANVGGDEIGDEFRNIVYDAISEAIMDPNPENEEAATKLADIMIQINPIFKNGLNTDAKKRYHDWKLKPLDKYPEPPNKPPPEFIKGQQAVHEVKSEVWIDANNPIIPNI